MGDIKTGNDKLIRRKRFNYKSKSNYGKCYRLFVRGLRQLNIVINKHKCGKAGTDC